jgi:hypothetical protein
MNPNSLASENVGVLATIDPVSQGVGAISTGYVDMAKFQQLLAVIQTGVLGAAATVDAKLQQATSAAGAGVKDVAGKAIVQIVKATGDNKQALINLRGEQLDVNNGFRYVRLTLTVGAAASLVGASLLGVFARNGLAADSNQAAVVQTVA